MSATAAKEILANWLAGETAGGASLFVFDNFETVADQGDTYRWIDNRVRLPNKVVITTRVRGFRGDYPVDVAGMTLTEFARLATNVARQLGIEGLVTEDYVQDLHRVSDGHPYVGKILLGEVARTGRLASADRIMATRDDILTALFERTFSLSLSPLAQRTFLTLSAWNSVVAELALKAALLRPGGERLDVEAAVDELIQASLVEPIDGPDDFRFLTVPLAAQLFGQSKLAVSADRASIESDLAVLRSFGAAQESDVAKGIGARTDALMRASREDFDSYRPMIEYVAVHYAPVWLDLAAVHHARDDIDAETDAVMRYVEARPLDPNGWRRRAHLARRRADPMTELNALVQLADLPGTSYRDISLAANQFNFYSANQRLEDAQAKRVLSERLQALMQSRIAEADATDLARLGWLCLHLADAVSAQEYARRGLEIDPSNRYCQDLLRRAS